MSPRPRTIWRVAALAAIPLNLSLATSAISPLLPTIRHETGISAAVGGLLTTIPLFCMGGSPPSLRALHAASVPSGSLQWDSRDDHQHTPALGAGHCCAVLRDAAARCISLWKRTYARCHQEQVRPSNGSDDRAVLHGGPRRFRARGRGDRTVDARDRVELASHARTVGKCGGSDAAHLVTTDGRTNARHTGLAVPAHPRLSHLYRDYLAWQVALYYGVQNLIYNGTAAWLPSLFVAHGLSQSDAGLLLAIVNLTGMSATLAVPVLAMRRPTQGFLVIATVALIATSLIGLLIAPVAGALVWMTLFGLGEGAAFSLGLSLIVLRSSDEWHATELSGMTQTFGFLFSALGPVGRGCLRPHWQLDLASACDAPSSVPLLVLGLGASRNRHVLAPPTSSG